MKQVQESSDEEEFDPKDMLVKRQAALASAISRPLIKPKERSPSLHTQVERYPFVWDTYAEAKLSAGFIQVNILRILHKWNVFCLFLKFTLRQSFLQDLFRLMFYANRTLSIRFWLSAGFIQVNILRKSNVFRFFLH